MLVTVPQGMISKTSESMLSINLHQSDYFLCNNVDNIIQRNLGMAVIRLTSQGVTVTYQMTADGRYFKNDSKIRQKNSSKLRT